MRRSILWCAIGTITIGLSGPASAQEPIPLERFAGDNRVATAVAVSHDNWDAASTALVATAADYPDALAAGALAAVEEAPLLLTSPTQLPPDVGAELERLGASTVLVLGGSAAVADAVLDELRALSTSPAVDRVAGDNRFTTAAAVARRVGAPNGEAVLALAANFPDAVSAGALAAVARTPTLLSSTSHVPDATMDVLGDLEVHTVTVVGGQAVVSDDVIRQLQEAGYQVRRLHGTDRYGTSRAVSGHALTSLPAPHPLVIATGQAFPDALSAAALAARHQALLMLVPTLDVPWETDEWLRARTDRFDRVMVVGGSAAVSGTAAEETRASAGDTIYGCVNINTAGPIQLRKIIHIDEDRSAEMTQIRPFSSIDDMIRINGIGPSRLQDIKDEGVACV